MARQGVTRVFGAANGGAANAGWFGDGRDGDLHVADGETLALEVDLDEGQVVKQYGSGYIGTGATLTAANRCNGMVLLFNGDLTINGHIHMDKKAPLLNSMEEQCAQELHIKALGAVTGGNGGAGGQGASRSRSSSSDSWGAAGGGAGGAAGLGFVLGGGFGGGGGGSNTNAPGGAGEPRAPIGSNIPYPAGNGVTLYGVGGSNNLAIGGAGPGGSGCATQKSGYVCAGYPGDSLGGGLLMIFVKGRLTIAPTGTCSANGGSAGSGAYQSGGGYSAGYTGGADYFGGGGGGGGGGIVAIIHNGDYINNGSILANGGYGGLRGGNNYSDGNIAASGSDGNVGTVLITTLAELLAG